MYSLISLIYPQVGITAKKTMKLVPVSKDRTGHKVSMVEIVKSMVALMSWWYRNSIPGLFISTVCIR